MFVCIMTYTTGVMLMMLTDAQKYLVLREKKGLITHCMQGWSRNMNYLGEIMLYASFGILVQRWEAWMIFSYMWGIIFVLRMSLKEYSLSKKPGFHEYQQKTWLLLPKLFNSDLWAYTIYGTLFSIFYFTYASGGIEKTLKSLF